MKNGKLELYQDLKRRILTLELQPGADLDESLLSKEYGISRTPLRDVFRHLAGEGYLSIENNRGACVSPLSHKTLRDFFLAAPMIYAATGRLAARNATRKQIAELADSATHFDEALDTGSTNELSLYNNRFHQLIGLMADNEFLLPSHNRLLIDHARISQTFYRADDPALKKMLTEASRQHHEMVAAIRNRDENRSEALIYEHWALSREFIEPEITPASLDIGL
ncbi:MAG: GntR family transcriptional regulator [Hyphomicrobiales bacterium]|nr:GntR family transcriptional regulator [Hyphomicrobiales bacterium]MCP4998583.1 GntR family transcriptional regulator [Hyphomicrobiales bacterium]